MTCENGSVRDIKIAYIGGGSRCWAWKFMTDLALESSIGGEIVLYDIDRDAAVANAIIGNRISAREDALGHWHYAVADTLKDALQNADFVVISILPGTFDEMEIDVHMPERIGVYQSVGDTAGPGVAIRALRTLPMLVPMVQGIREFCPNAWVINYTNPMSLCVRMLYFLFPEIKAFGCCHEVFNAQKLFANIVQEQLNLEEKPSRQDIRVNVMGLNHFTWITKAYYNGMDLFPMFKKFVDEYSEKGYFDPHGNSGERVKMDLFKRYGYVGAAGDRHLAEFMPGNLYLKDPATVAAWNFELTSVASRKEDLKKRLVKSAQLVNGETDVEMKASGEEGVQIIKALLGLERLVTNVNLPNHGQITNLPRDVVVETNAVFDRDSIQPVMVGAMPENIQKLTMPHAINYELILKAVLTQDSDYVVQAFLNDPNVSAKCRDEEVIRRLVNDMIAATSRYLPDGWKK